MAAAVFEIPLLTGTPQRFSMTLAGIEYKMTLLWRNAPDGGWVLDIADNLGNPMVGGIPLVTGIDLLGQYAYLGFGGQMVVQTDHDVNAVPTFDNIGDTSHVYFITSS